MTSGRVAGSTSQMTSKLLFDTCPQYEFPARSVNRAAVKRSTSDLGRPRQQIVHAEHRFFTGLQKSNATVIAQPSESVYFDARRSVEIVPLGQRKTPQQAAQRLNHTRNGVS